jgi:hypothetical protein
MSQERLGSVLEFLQDSREKRERLVEIAKNALPLMEAALREDNARLLQRVFQALGAAARGDDGGARSWRRCRWATRG